MDNPMEEVDEVANRTATLLGEFAAELIRKYRVPPETVAKAAIGTAVLLFLEFNTDDERAAASYLRQVADEIDEGTPSPTVN